MTRHDWFDATLLITIVAVLALAAWLGVRAC